MEHIYKHTEFLKQYEHYQPGQVMFYKDYEVLCVKCGHDSESCCNWLGIYKLAPMGKKTFTASQFNNGYVKQADKDKRLFKEVKS